MAELQPAIATRTSKSFMSPLSNAQEHTPTREAVKPSRAQALRDKVEIRLAVNAAGPEIAEILKENGIELDGADWSKVFPHWLIATVDDDVIGCLQVMPSKPIAYCEMLCVKPGVSFKLRAIAIRKLILQGIATAYHGGASYVACNVDYANDKFVGVIEKLNVRRMCERTLFVKRLRD